MKILEPIFDALDMNNMELFINEVNKLTAEDIKEINNLSLEISPIFHLITSFPETIAIPAIMLLVEKGVTPNPIEENGLRLLDKIMTEATTWGKGGRKAVLLAALGAVFKDDGSKDLSAQTYQYRKRFNDYFYRSPPIWRTTSQAIADLVVFACEKGLVRVANRVLGFTTPAEVRAAVREKTHQEKEIETLQRKANINYVMQSERVAALVANPNPMPSLPVEPIPDVFVKEYEAEVRKKIFEEREEQEKWLAQIPAKGVLIIKINFLLDEDNTFLHVAAGNGQTEMLGFLLAKGANPLLQNKYQQTPAAYAVSKEVTEEKIVPLLKATGEKYEDLQPKLMQISSQLASVKISDEPVKLNQQRVNAIMKACTGSNPNYGMFKLLITKMTSADYAAIEKEIINKKGTFYEFCAKYQQEKPEFKFSFTISDNSSQGKVEQFPSNLTPR